MRAGVVHVKHASKPLAYFGRLGETFDQCLKVIVELLREEGMYKSNGFIVADVLKDAVKDVRLDVPPRIPTLTPAIFSLSNCSLMAVRLHSSTPMLS